MAREIIICKDEGEIKCKLTDMINKIAKNKLQKCNVFKIGLSGGSLINYACHAFTSISTEWTKWRFFFCDERVVPFDSEESTFGLYRKKLLGNIPITEQQFITINPNLSVQAAAEDYTNQMKEYFDENKLPEFDLLLLGIGPDGHTCSLFPGHQLLKEENLWVASIADSPKPPPCRITLTLPVVNNAHNVIFLASGAGKSSIVKDIFKENSADPLPAARVSPVHGQLYWLLDQAAATQLNE